MKRNRSSSSDLRKKTNDMKLDKEHETTAKRSKKTKSKPVVKDDAWW
ncbi:hypothetical protein KSS87_007884 [Heliosperma pusillum]|nr:hypothetical protein KSS87_007884 [Heliosperma pusillum]